MSLERSSLALSTTSSASPKVEAAVMSPRSEVGGELPMNEKKALGAVVVVRSLATWFWGGWAVLS